MDYYSLMNTRARELKPSGIRKYFDLIGMDDVIALGVGQPDFPMPERARVITQASLDDGHVPYTANAGVLSLREAICDYLDRRFDLHFDPVEETLVTVGGSEAIDLMLRTVINPGDEVIVPEPTFVCYGPLAELCGGVKVSLPLRMEDDFRLTPEALHRVLTPRTKVLVLPFPTNPTGGVMSREDLEAIGEVLEGTNVLVLSDEVYAELTYTGGHVSAASIPSLKDRTVLVSSTSKPYAMTGLRMGYACGPAPIIAAMTRVHQYGIMSAPTTAQIAAEAALRACDDDIEIMKASYDRRRRIMLEGFERMGLPCYEPKGAFYVFPCIRQSGLSSEEFCDRLLNEGRVAVVPGDAFGESGEGYIRICYAYAEEDLREALRRMEIFWKRVTQCAAE
ncbi:MAG: aminotransferase class I/II-fold pyridoxal phosphate-dependent enzyme [Ruminococcaceae bacterium]|nr:aminotransferase class I/II-fold pyridoxal phosphate-dependent enzyme [Oscillospiraceae bacterium]